MLKHKKNQPTAQELYRARKRREEQEKDAYLPPGLINHGNTCFMNSTLQGLMATEVLHHLVNFEPVSPAAGASVLARRSPQLTNGHGFGGEYERPWEEGMPLGDVFVKVMQRAWGMQEARRRESISPKEILTGIGRKYDQYLDFRQQDAHEFLRYMLDAMRMEELDIIKKRQPPPPKDKTKRSRKKRHTRSLPSTAAVTMSDSAAQTSLSEPTIVSPTVASVPALAEDEKLASFVDMLFGGRLASILVCEKCKKVSVTYEEFNDLSLSIKPEDYIKGRKRDRIKNLAKKLRFRPPGTGSGSDRDRDETLRRRRSSSVPPPSPLRKSFEVASHEHEELPVHDGPRRVSFDHAGQDADEAREVVRELVGDKAEVASAVEDDEDGGWHVTVEADAAEDTPKDKVDGEQGKKKDKEKDKEDSWGKFGRRISVSMKMTRRVRELGSPSHSVERGRRSESKEGVRFLAKKDSKSARSSLAPSRAYESGTDNDMSDAAVRPSIPPSPVPSPLASPHISSATLAQLPPFKRAHSDTPFSQRRSRSPAPPKLSHEETAYLRRILADVNPSPTNPFSMLQQALSATHHGVGPSSSSLAAHALWARMGHLPGVVECLRMFTAVEVLDGENMVGCHRCWKNAHGECKPRRRGEPAADDVDSENEESEESEEKLEGSIKAPESRESVKYADGDGRPSSSPEMSTGRVSPASMSVISMSAMSDPEYLNDTKSVSTAPSTVDTRLVSSGETSPNGDVVISPATSSMVTYGGLPIPSISTTAPEASHSASGTAVNEVSQLDTEQSRPSSSLATSPLAASLLTPRRRKRTERKSVISDDSSDSSDDSDSSGSLSDSSANTTAYSDASPVASPAVSPTASPRDSVGDLRLPASPSADNLKTSNGTSPKIPRSKQVIPCRMYKRYLIATPPPILVVHLKRFQQASKSHAVSFSGGFKKLDDFVAFPEELDLGPFLAPRKEDYGLNVKGKPTGAARGPEHCMYRLYAVVVHIGNMLGGHYIAYTALPPSHPAPVPPSPQVPSTEPDSATSVTPTSPTPMNTTGSEHAAKSHKSPRQWAYISDTVVRLTTLDEVLKAKAYICMYERI